MSLSEFDGRSLDSRREMVKQSESGSTGRANGQQEKFKSYFFLIRFIIEIVSVSALSYLVYFIRYRTYGTLQANVFNVPRRKVVCPLTVYEKPEKLPSFVVQDDVFIIVLFTVPIGVIMVGEIIRFLIKKDHSKTKNILNIPLPLQVRRMIRITGCFYFGFLITSILSDTLSFLSNQATPYLYYLLSTACYPKACTPNTLVDIVKDCQMDESVYNEFFRSFPNYQSAVSAYAATYTACYLQSLLRVPGSYVVSVILTSVLCGLSATASLSQWIQGSAHWQDVAAGWILGIALATYIIWSLHYFNDANIDEQDQDVEDIAELRDVDEDRLKRYIPRIQAVNRSISDSKADISKGASRRQRNLHETLSKDGGAYSSDYRSPPIRAYDLTI